jgi:hypothetical protein
MGSPLRWSKSQVPFVRTAEIWVSQRDVFLFRFIVPSRGDRWTFIVHRDDLDELAGHPVEPEVGFHQFRLEIYAAAERRMANGNPMEQQRLAARDIGEVRSLIDRSSSSSPP